MAFPTISLSRPTVPPITGGISTPTARVAAYRAATDRTSARHRARSARKAATRASLQVGAVFVVLAATLITWVRENGMHVAGMGCFVAAGFAVGEALGWFVAGLAILWTQHLNATPEAPPQQ